MSNAFGEWIYGFSGSCSHTTNLNAELLAILHGLRIAWQARHTSVIFEYDSKSALELINGQVTLFHPFAPLVNFIRSFQTQNWTIIFQHTLCERNDCADWLAKHGANSDQVFSNWQLCPPQLTSVLLDDTLGVIWIRK